jgi:hypothetical protein
MQVNPTTLKAIRAEIDEALAKIAKANPGLKSLHLANGSYDPQAGHFSFKLEGVAEGGVDKFEQCYNEMAPLLGLMPLGSSTITVGGKEYKAVGMKPGGNNKVIAARVPDGKKFLFANVAFKAKGKAKTAETA